MSKSTRTEKRYSVCIGIDQYHPTAGLSTLRYAESDARAMDALFSQLGFEAGNRCLLLGEAATLDAVNTALATILLDTAGENDLVVFYFAGHSLPLVINQRQVEKQGEELRSEVFLTTYDFDRQKIQQYPSFRKQHALGMERLRKDYFESEGSRKRLFIFDSCYSGDFYGRQYRDEADPIQGYIRHMLDSTSAGRVALSSCLPIQKAVEDPALGHGRFTYYLLKALSGETIEALGRDGCLTVNGLFDYVAKQLPIEQRPVLSGVQQDSFELVCFPDKVALLRLPEVETEDIRQREKNEHLKALIIDHSSFIQSRLESFVGREQELADLRQNIGSLLLTGGYLTITGQAGQGKSSIITRLVQEYHPDEVAHHFIPFNPGPDYQVSLLRDLMARLILKYDLSDYYVASESRPALRDFFPKVLAAIAAQGKQEVIFIDGLDQLKEDTDGERDLSFLPDNPPEGIVFVLGSRPNETLRPLELHKPVHPYHLQGTARSDFDLILQHRNVQLERGFADRFYRAMGENALYLDLVAKELAQDRATKPEEIIERVADDPDNIFTLSTIRLKRHAGEWREVLKPLLGVLLVSREPLTTRQLRAILSLDDERCREGIARLGGLVADDGKNRYTLFHLKLYDYLRQDESKPYKEYIFARDEEEGWHNTLAQWCDRGGLSTIWEDARYVLVEQERREYARKHYVTHLYAARSWQRLFEVLDTAQYGQAKIREDPSTRSYALDLDLGRQATMWEGWTVEEGIALLPRLWQYTLLRCSLTSRADRYPEEAFQLLILLGRKQEALGLAELLTNLAFKVRVIQRIANQLRAQASQESEWLELLMRAGEVARTLQDSSEQTRALKELGTALAQAGQWAEAERVIGTIQSNSQQADALLELGTALARAGQKEQASQVWAEAERVIATLQSSSQQTRALKELGTALAQAGQKEQASQVWVEAERVIGTLQSSSQQTRALKELGTALAQAGQWAEAERVIGTLQDSKEQTRALKELGTALVQAGQWAEAERVIGTLQDSSQQADALLELGTALAQAGQRAEAKRVIGTLQSSSQQARALKELGTALARAGLKEQASQVWAEAKRVIGTIRDSKEQARALKELGTALVQAGQWAEAERVIGTLQRSSEQTRALFEQTGALSEQTRALIELGTALAQAGLKEQASQVWAEAERVIATLQYSYEQADALNDLATMMARTNKLKQLLHLIQRAWRQVETREEALTLFSIASAVISCTTDIGTAFLSAFSWVDTFLGG